MDIDKVVYTLLKIAAFLSFVMAPIQALGHHYDAATYFALTSFLEFWIADKEFGEE